MSLVEAILTGSTCGFACWEAREEVCRCSCGGRNHGIFRNGGEMPKRTCKIKGFWYELHSIGGYHEAENECHDLRIAANGGTYLGTDGYVAVYRFCKPGDLYHCKPVAPHQKNWLEVKAVLENERYPRIIWHRIPSPLKGS